MADDELPFLRITLLGAAGSGKTSLIESFVNNAVAPGIPPTTYPTLSYTVVRLGNLDKDDAKAAGEEGSRVLVEIEDTFGSDGVGTIDAFDHRSMTVASFYDLWWPSSGSSAAAQPKGDAAKKRRQPGKRDDANVPLAPFNAPLDGKFRPLTRNRMAYLICFDSTDTHSFKEALKVHTELQRQFGKLVDAGVGPRMKPLVYLVATKIDKDPWNDEYRRVLDSARRYTEGSEDNSINALEEVSAIQHRGISRLLRRILSDVRANTALWQVMTDKERPENSALNKAADCSIQ